MKKKAISIILVLCITLSLLPQSAFAAEPEDPAEPPEVSAETEEPTEQEDPPVKEAPTEAEVSDAPDAGAEDASEAQLYSERVAWPVEGGNIYFDPDSGAIVDCDQSVTNADIPSEISGVRVTSIGGNAFSACSKLTSVSIPDSVASFGKWAFHHCSGLTSISIPEGVTSIPYCMFGNCYGLTNISIPDSVTSIETYAFSHCSGLTSITIPSNVTSIGTYAFEYCSGLTSISIPNSVTSIGIEAFSYCSGLTSVSIPDSVTSIGADAFRRCSGLTSVSIPGSVTSINRGVFSGCNGLTCVTIPNSVTSIGSYAFSSCSGLTSITIPSSVTNFGQFAFSGCSGLTSVSIPNSITSIEYSAFDGCNGLVDVFYGGTEEDWAKIKIDTYNSPLTDATIHYNSGGPGITFHRVYRTPSYPGDNGYEVFDISLEECLAKKPSAEYNPQLAHMLIAMCGSVHEDGNIRRTFDSFGFLPENCTTSYDTLSSGIMLAYGMARKQYTDENGNEKTLVLTVARGTDDWNEWASNILDSAPDSTGLHGGFSDAGSALRTKLREFLGTVDYSNMTFVITGFSRGAAAANILEQRLLDTGVREEQLYGYNFACPEVGLVSETEHSHRCMFNLSDAADAVSWVHGLGFGWGKYGRSFWFSNDWSDYQALKTSTSPHSEVKYLEFLRNEKPVEEYRQRGAADAALKDAGARRAAEESKKYFQGSYRGRIRRVSQHCPVNVEVYNADGQSAGSVIDGEVRIELPDDVYIYTLQDEKFIYLLREGNYDIRMTGTDTGAMSYVIEDIDMETWEALETKTFESVALTTGKEFASNINVQDTPDAGTKVKDVPLYVLGDSAEPGKAVLADGSGTEVPLLRLTADASGGLHGAISLLREDGSAGTEGLCGYVAAYDANGRFRGVEECRISSSGQSLTLELQGGLHTETGAGPVLKAFVVGPNMAPVCGTDTVQAIA